MSPQTSTNPPSAFGGHLITNFPQVMVLLIKNSHCPDRVSIAQWSEHLYVKPEALGSILGWGSQITFRNRQRFGLIRISSSIFSLRCRRRTLEVSVCLFPYIIIEKELLLSGTKHW